MGFLDHNVSFKSLRRLLLNEPDYVLKQIKPVFLRGLNKKIVGFYPSYSFALKYLWIILTYKCNLRCKMCGLWGDYGIWKNLPPEKLNKEMSLEEIFTLIDDVEKYQPMILLTGGEPLLANNWQEIAKYIKAKNLRCNISTNGTEIYKIADDVIELIDNIDVSIDGPCDGVHDEIRGVKGTFEKVMKGIKRLDEMKKREKRKKPYLKISYTITNLNYKNLVEMIEFLENEDLKVDTLIFRHQEFSDEKLLNEYRNIFIDEFNIKDNCFSGFLYKPKDIDPDFLVDEIKKIKKMSTKNISCITFEPELDIDEIKDFYTDSGYFSKRFKRCMAPWLGITVLPDGYVWACPNYVIGNLKDDRFKDFWNNKEVKKLRRRIASCGLFPVCRACASLYIY